MPTSYNDLDRIAQNLKKKHTGRQQRQRAMQSMARNIDPRTSAGVRDTPTMFEERNVYRPNSTQKFLKTNDPRTFLDLVVFLLAGNELNWTLPVYSRENQDEKEDHQKAERLVLGLFQQNDQRLIDKGMPRLNRAIWDSACRYGMSVVYRQVYTDDTGEQSFIMEPWDPLYTYEQFGAFGLKRIAREVVWEIGDLREMAKDENSVNGTDSTKWTTEQITGEDADNITLMQIFEMRNDRVVESVIATDQKLVLLDGRRLDADEIPIKVSHYNGEAFPGHLGEYQGQSILEANYALYLDHSDLLNRIEAHGKRVVNPVYDEFTLGGQPKADPNFMNPGKGANVQSYDAARGESGRRVVQTQSMDASLQIQNNEIVGFVQRGGVPYALFGNVEIQLSGFAIKQLLNAALSTAGEIQEVGSMMFSDLGRWVLDGFKESTSESITIAGFSPTASRREYFVEDYAPEDVPEFTGIRAVVSLATPDDLLERLNMIRNARPAGGNFLSLETAFEGVIPDLVPDSSSEIDALNEEEVIALPSVRLIKARRQILRLAQKIETSDPEEAGFLREEAAALLQQLGRGGDSQTQPTPEVNGQTEPGAVPRQVRQQGGPADPRNAVAV